MYGANKSLINIIEELKDTIDFFVITPHAGPLINELKKRKIKVSISFKYEYWMHKKNQKLTLYFYIKRYVRFILSFIDIYIKVKIWNIDIIHSNSSVISIGAYVAKLAKTKHVWHIREMGEEHYCSQFDKGKDKSLKIMNKYSDRILFISQTIANKYSNVFTKKKSKIIYDGVKINQYKLNKNRNNRIPILVLVGLLYKNKGQEIAIKAIFYLKKSINKIVKLQIIGNGPAYYELKELVKKLNICDQVFFMGYQENVYNYLLKADIGLMCSQHEAFGLVTVEYMLAGLPVIGSNSGGTREIVIDNETGYLYEPGNYLDLSTKIEDLLSNQSRMKEFGLEGCKRAKSEFSIEKMGNEMKMIYESLING